MELISKKLPDGKVIYCTNEVEADFSIQDIYSDELNANNIHFPKQGGCFLDVGANIGLFSCFVSGKYPSVQIHAFEPIPSTVEILRKNLADLPNCKVHAVGAGKEERNIEFIYFPNLTSLSSSNEKTAEVLASGIRSMAHPVEEKISAGDNSLLKDEEFLDSLLVSEKVKCPIVPLSKIIADENIKEIDLVKIDTEGNELEVLAGIEEKDWPKIKQLIVEVHIGQEQTLKIQKMLELRGYQTSIADHPLTNHVAPVFHVYARRTMN